MNEKKLIIIVAVFSIILIGIAVVSFSTSSQNQKPQTLASSYSASDKDRPSVQVKNTSSDLGNMKVSDEKSVDFIIKNIGSKPLQISNMKSSCGCTLGKLIYNGSESPEFGMHSQTSGVIAEIEPSKEATVRVIYRPFIMPVYGFVEREVYVVTNDPQNSQITFKVTATVK